MHLFKNNFIQIEQLMKDNIQYLKDNSRRAGVIHSRETFNILLLIYVLCVVKVCSES
jgi:hypothetical protein